MTRNINSDTALKDIARSFFSAALQRTRERRDAENSAGFSLIKGVLFSVTVKIVQVRNDRILQ